MDPTTKRPTIMYTENQISWQQFSSKIRGNTDEDSKRIDDEREANFDVEVSTPKRHHHHATEMMRRRVVVRFQNKVDVMTHPAANDNDGGASCGTAPHHRFEVVEKSKTRAARRQIDDTMPHIPTAAAAAADPSTKRERRSNYWIHQDDKRRHAARLFKLNALDGEGGV